MATKIRGVSAVMGRHKTNFLFPDNKTVTRLEVRLTNGVYFDIETDSDGDVVITSSAHIKVLSDSENELIFGMKKDK